MNKLFQAMWIAVAILAAWLIRRWPTLAVAGVLLAGRAVAAAGLGLDRAEPRGGARLERRRTPRTGSPPTRRSAASS